jgi:hypothetical protein
VFRATHVIPAALFAGLLFISPVVHAQSLADRETARGLMDDGDKKRDGGDLKGALQSYEKADALMKVPTTAIEVARTQIALGLLLEARETLNRIQKMPPKAGEPAPFAVARKTAGSMNDDLAGRIPSVLIVPANTEPGQPATITFDGEDIPPAAQSVPRKVNPGNHSITVKSGTLEKKVDITVAEKETKTVNVDLKDQPKTPPPPPPPPPPPQKEGIGTGKILMFGGFGLAAVGIGVGAVTGLMSMSKTSDLKDTKCKNNKCQPGTQGDIDSATTLGNISTIGFIVGGVGAGLGVVGIILNGKEAKAKEDAAPAAGASAAFKPVDVRAVLGPSYAGISGKF